MIIDNPQSIDLKLFKRALVVNKWQLDLTQPNQDISSVYFKEFEGTKKYLLVPEHTAIDFDDAINDCLDNLLIAEKWTINARVRLIRDKPGATITIIENVNDVLNDIVSHGLFYYCEG